MTGTSEWGVKTFGDMGSQHAASGSGNMIAVTKGGKRRARGGSRRTRKGKGGAGLTEVAVPAALLIANEIGKNVRKSRRFSRRNRNMSRRR